MESSWYVFIGSIFLKECASRKAKYKIYLNTQRSTDYPSVYSKAPLIFKESSYHFLYKHELMIIDHECISYLVLFIKAAMLEKAKK